MNTITDPLKDTHKSHMKRGDLNPQWRGDNVGYKCLHRWIRRNKPMADVCENCNQPKRLEAANISQQYLRDLSDWKWLCRSCHMMEDGRMRVLASYVAPKLNRKCDVCPKSHKAKGFCRLHYDRYCGLRRAAV